jgi:importin subunit beta-1
MSDITQILLSASGQDQDARTKAQATLEDAQKKNLPIYLITLVTELANESKPPVARQMAGLLLKNVFNSRDVALKQTLAQQWTQLTDEVKQNIRNQVLQTLHSPTAEVRKTCAQVLAQLASIDLPQGQWVDVVNSLLTNVQRPSTPFGVESSLTALGFICEETKAPILQQQSHLILTAVVQGMRAEQTNEEIKLAATTALLNALEFVKQNFEQDQERDYIMKVVCETTQSANMHVRRRAFECLVKIALLYYHKLKPYMEAIFTITLKAAEQDKEDVALQAIEFWSTVAETEDQIIEDNEIAEDNDLPPQREYFQFIRSALAPLCKLLTGLLTRQKEGSEDDELTVSSSAGTCLALVARVVRDEILKEVVPFVTSNINSGDWRLREAATLCFSAILDGPSTNEMSILVQGAIPVMINHVKDPVEMVKDTTVFTIGRIAKFHPDTLIGQTNILDQVLNAIGVAMMDDSKVSAKACWALHNIAEAFEEIQEEDQQTYPLSNKYEVLIGALFKTADRDDVTEDNLRINAYEALSALIGSAARDTFEFLDTKVIPELLVRLERTITPQQNADLEDINMVQGLLCGVLQSLTNKLGDRVRKHADNMMVLFLRIFQSKSASTVHEETLMAVGALASALSFDFDRYMKAFAPFLYNGLRNQQEEQVCSVSISILGDVCAALGDKIAPYCNDIMTILLQNLHSPQLSKNIKPPIIAVFGDIALAIQGEFEKYLQYVGIVLKQASEAQVDDKVRSDEMIEYLNMLRESIFEAYIGILQGLKKQKPQAFNNYVDQLVSFLRVVSLDENVDQEVFKNAVSVIGDLANVYGMKIKNLLSQDFIMSLVNDACTSGDKETKKVGQFTKKQLKKIQIGSG